MVERCGIAVGRGDQDSSLHDWVCGKRSRSRQSRSKPVYDGTMIAMAPAQGLRGGDTWMHPAFDMARTAAVLIGRARAVMDHLAREKEMTTTDRGSYLPEFRPVVISGSVACEKMRGLHNRRRCCSRAAGPSVFRSATSLRNAVSGGGGERGHR